MSVDALRLLRPYAVAFGTVTIAFLLTSSFNWLGQESPALLFTAAVAVCAWLGGYRPAIFTALLSLPCIHVISRGPQALWHFAGVDVVRLIVFAAVAVLISTLQDRCRRAEKVLQAEQNSLKAVMASLSEGIVTVDGSGVVTSVNPAASKLLGWKPEELIGLRAHEAFHHQRADGSHYPAEECTLYSACIRDRAVQDQEDWFVKRDGSLFPVICSLVPVQENGVSMGAVLSFWDNSQRHKTEVQLRWSETKFRHLFDNSLQAQSLMEDGRFIDCNRNAVQMLGFEDAAQVIGHSPVDLSPEFQPDGTSSVELARQMVSLARSEGSHRFDWVALRADGEPFAVEVTLTRLEIDGKTLIHGAWRDITRDKQVVAERDRFFEHSVDMFVTVDFEGRIQRVNPAWTKVTGYSQEETLGAPYMALIHPNDQKATSEVAERRTAGALTRDFENRYLCKDGQYRWISWNAVPLVEEKCLFAVGRDVSARKAAEQELQRAHDSLNMALQAGNSGMYEWNCQEDRAYWTPEMEALNGFAPGEYPGTYEAWKARIHPEDREQAEAAVQAAMVAGEFRGEWRVIAPDGQVRWLEARGKVLLDENQQPHTFLGINIDITDRKLAEARLIASEALYHSLTDSLPHVVMICDPQGKIEYANHQWSLLTGLPNEAAETFEWLSIVHPEDLSTSQKLWRWCMETGQSFETEFRLCRHEDGEYVWFLSTCVPVRDQQGQVVKWIGTLTDIHAAKQTEVERERLLVEEARLRSEAEETSRLKDEFLATLSHELRTPLNAILGWARILSTGGTDQETTLRGLETIERNAKSQAQLIGDILDVSRIITGKFRLEVRAVDIADVVSAAVETVRHAADAKRIQVEVAVEPGVEPVQGDPDRLQQIVWNLVSNAIKFTPEGGTVGIQVKRAGDELHVVVRDSGRGISREFLPHVFERFRQADATSTKVYGGLGLGLAIVRHLVEMHGGRVEAWSEGEGFGATFTAIFPVMQSKPETAVPPTPASTSAADLSPKIGRLQGTRILVVDDQQDTRELMSFLLQRHGAEVHSASGVDEAMGIFETLRPDLLLSDIQMPEKDGFDLIESIRKLPIELGGATPAAAITASAGVADRAKVLRAGFQEHIAKPVEPGAVLQIVSQVLGR